MSEFEYTRKEGESDYQRTPEWLAKAFGKKIMPLIHEDRVGEIMAIIGPAANQFVNLTVEANQILEDAMKQLKKKEDKTLGSAFLDYLIIEHRKENDVHFIFTKKTGETVIHGQPKVGPKKVESDDEPKKVASEDETPKDLHNRLMAQYRTKTMHPDDHNTMLVVGCCESYVTTIKERLGDPKATKNGFSLTSLWEHITQSLTHVDEDWGELLAGTLCLNGWIFTAEDRIGPAKGHPIWEM